MKKENYMENNCVAYQFKELITYDTPVHDTWSLALNRHLDGGLTDGLYVLAGAPSIGKTAFTLHLADSIAKEDHDVLFISFDTSRIELMAKSVSRTTAQMVTTNDMDMSIAKTFKEISLSSKKKYSSDTERSVLEQSIRHYQNYAHRIFIVEASGNFGTTQIRKTIEEHIAITGNTPVVFVDYLQALAPIYGNTTDSHNVNKTLLELKQINKDFNTPVWTTSTISRESYEHPVSLQSINSESIEYLADVVIGMNLVEVETEDKSVRTISLDILKNKYGTLRDKLNMSFYTKFNLFY